MNKNPLQFASKSIFSKVAVFKDSFGQVQVQLLITLRIREDVKFSCSTFRSNFVIDADIIGEEY